MSTAHQLQQSNNTQIRSAAGLGSPFLRALPAAESAQPSGITELVLTQHSPDAQVLLLPMLAHLSRDNERWITWITDTPVDRVTLAAYGVDTKKIRLIQEKSDEFTRWVLWEALNTGTSHTVIAALSDISEQTLSHLEDAAQAGNSRGLLIRYR